ncbi:hypothetical protein EFN12_04855 [Pediococcus pentosaceus]|nr:hypothetical protein GBP05_07505 [Pediococcus pentosaceus]MBF7138550.1 hypothetical protein [Pediococcus pentosaceus]MCM6810619.1 hypothetical protein [Pediococcus pentosaceus]MCT3023943.1 hypothetical protein [Pediococcus pentosaceus]
MVKNDFKTVHIHDVPFNNQPVIIQLANDSPVEDIA